MNIQSDRIILKPEDHYQVGEKEFGTDGLIAIESVGPFTSIQHVGPIITIHDSLIKAGQGIGHHPHRHNERLFYLERGTFDHDDALNDVQGHIEEGDMARFTEGMQGMIHKEWNNGDVDAEIYIIVAITRPVPENMHFDVLKHKNMPVTHEPKGTKTTWMVGGSAPLPIYSDIRTFTDTSIEPEVEFDWEIPANEGAILSVREGTTTVDSKPLKRKSTVVFPPQEEPRKIALKSTSPSRIIRVTFGEGLGLLVN